MDTRTPGQILRERAELMRAYKQALGTTSGKRVLADLIARFSERTSFDPVNPYVTSEKEGERKVVLYVNSQIHGDPAALEQDIQDEEK